VLDFRHREKIICFVWDVTVAQHSPILAHSLSARVNVSLTYGMFRALKGKFEAEGRDLGAFGFTSPAPTRPSDAVMEPFFTFEGSSAALAPSGGCTNADNAVAFPF
jgi:hypothetical protein